MFLRSFQLPVFVSLILLSTQAWGQDPGQYFRARSGPVTLYYQRADSGFAMETARIIRSARPEFEKMIGVHSEPDIHVMIAESGQAFDRLTHGSIPDWGAGAADPGSGFIFLKSPRFGRPGKDPREIILHELSHVLLGQATGGMVAPRWFDEGLAQLLSGEREFRASLRLARSFASGQPMWLDQIHDVLLFRRDEAGLAYETAHSAVLYLTSEYGEAVIARLVLELAGNHSMDEALQAVIGKSLGEFESDWYETMRRKTRWALLLDFPVLISATMVALLFAALISTRRRARRKRLEWEMESEYEVPLD